MKTMKFYTASFSILGEVHTSIYSTRPTENRKLNTPGLQAQDDLVLRNYGVFHLNFASVKNLLSPVGWVERMPAKP